MEPKSTTFSNPAVVGPHDPFILPDDFVLRAKPRISMREYLQMKWILALAAILIIGALFCVAAYASTNWDRWMLFFATFVMLGFIAAHDFLFREKSR